MRYGDVAERAHKLEQGTGCVQKRSVTPVWWNQSGSKQAGLLTQLLPEKVSSIREAFENAKRELAS